MSSTPSSHAGTSARTQNRYRLPGIEREGIAQLSLLETALWPLQGGSLPGGAFETTYSYSSNDTRNNATVTVRAPLGLQSVDELILWGLLAATLAWKDPDPVLHATPYWMLKHLGLDTGGYQYTELRHSLLRLAVASYHNTAFYNPHTKEREYAAFQFLSVLLPTVGGVGERVDDHRAWRIEWNPAFFRFCQATGSTLLFDLGLYRKLSPPARRLFLKLKDRFWRDKRVFMNVNDLTTNGLGFAASRPLKKRKYDLKKVLQELVDARIIQLGRGQTAPEELFLKRAKGSYVVVFHEGEYFRQAGTERVLRQKNALEDDPLVEPLRQIGVDGPAIRRILKKSSRGLLQRWIRITEAAMHEKPKGFLGFRSSPAAFLIDGVEQKRTAPDWFHAHEKRIVERAWKKPTSLQADEDPEHRRRFEHEREMTFQAFLGTAEGRRLYEQTFAPYQTLYQATEPHRAREAAHEATLHRLRRTAFSFPEFDDWASARRQVV